MKEIMLKQIGYRISGFACLNLWGGGLGTIEIKPEILLLKDFSKDNLCSCINDSGFGCESVEWANIDVSILYENGYVEYDRTIHTDSIHHLKYAFRGITPKN